MSLVDENNGVGTTMLVQPSGYANGGGFGNMWGGDGFWVILLFLLLGNNGWGNGYGSGGGTTYVANDVQRGFDQAAVTTGINGISNAMCNGFSNVQQSLCNGFAQAEISNNARQMADMNQQFALQSQLASCCCENRLATAGLQNVIQTEACADRQAVTNALFDVTAQGNANTTALMTAMNNGFQSIRDQMCNDKIAAKDDLIAELRQRVTMQDLAASQATQTGQLIADNAAQTQYVVNRIAPYPQPAYIVSNPNLGVNNCGCGCGCGVA